MKRTILAFGFFLILSIDGCSFFFNPIERNDIYAKCAKGDTISFELFKKSQRIIKTEKWYLIWLDLYDDRDGLHYAPHLLICDHKLVLKGASGICPEINEAHGDTLFGIMSEEYIADKNKIFKPYRDDLPTEVILNLKKKEKIWNGFQRNPLAIVDSIQLLQNTWKAKFYLKTSDSIFFPDRKQYFENIDYYSTAFQNSKILEYPISLLHFDRGRKYIFTIEDNDFQFEMHTLDDKVLDKFLFDIWRVKK
jgi:hypothetical protein